ncbi:hypothetical protein ABZ467_24445 [Streptomyces sp. NPDC005727]|uniref:hypothetical protein n=1 Tax=unclassified Streptomyces TaxID=2593676 RepID=UPI0033EB7E8D
MWGLIKTAVVLTMSVACVTGCSQSDSNSDISSSSCTKDAGENRLPKKFGVDVPPHVRTVRCRIVETWDSESLSLVFDGSKQAADRLLGQFGHSLKSLRWGETSSALRLDQWGVDECFPDGLNGRCSFIEFETGKGNFVVFAKKSPNGSVRVSLDMTRS